MTDSDAALTRKQREQPRATSLRVSGAVCRPRPGRTRLAGPLWLILFLFFCIPALPARAALPVRAAMLINLDTGRVLYEQNADAPIPPASLTKIMTMFLAMDAARAKSLSLNEKVKISRQAASTGGSSMHLRAGERVPLVRLLTGMAVASGNDAAVAVAQRVSGGNIRNFVRRMNSKARALGMRRTVFKNSTGLPAAGQKTTARDMATLSRAYLRAHPGVMRFHSTRFFLHRGRALRNTNPLLGGVPGVNGLKTGWTVASGYNIVVTAQRGKTRLLAVVLGGDAKDRRDVSARRLIEAGFRHPASPRQVRHSLTRRR
ncbi:D-alanyl-D-alanine carboxypeptidase family protein [Desulfovibrio sp. SGI.169]|uniref:D-alanyl-D-alanine carboxypeptidase family protein n=1 Tax=Desulfovibrio sp. SGI.169 TaxID=3420561 RepID=UPI003D06C44C